MRITARFSLEKQTKGAVVYSEVDTNGKIVNNDEAGMVVGRIYVRKRALKGLSIPQQLIVVLQGDDDGL